ncbi:MAG: hypothetical protein AAFP22_12685, partial [Planctomycetota bacterium]
EEAERRLRRAFERSGVGAALDSVEVLTAHAPRAVHREYRRVASAQVDARTDLTVAEWKAAERLAEVRMDAAEVLARATNAAQDEVARARGAVARLVALDAVWSQTGGLVEGPLRFDAWRNALDATKGARRRVFAVLARHVVVTNASGAAAPTMLQPLSPR